MQDFPEAPSRHHLFWAQCRSYLQTECLLEFSGVGACKVFLGLLNQGPEAGTDIVPLK